MVTKRDLVEKVWRNSNLTWQEADRIISDAVSRGICWGQVEAYNAAIRLLRE